MFNVYLSVNLLIIKYITIFYKTIKDNIIKDNLYNFFENTKQLNWLVVTKTNKFFFNKDLKLPKNSGLHYSLIDIKPALTPAFSNYHVFMTHSLKNNGITLAHIHLFTPNKGISYLSLILYSSIELSSISNAIVSTTSILYISSLKFNLLSST